VLQDGRLTNGTFISKPGKVLAIKIYGDRIFFFFFLMSDRMKG
jgi:hypothetical protein